jgi:hypothetical protein
MDKAASLRAGAIAASIGWLAAIAMTVLSKGVDLQVTQTVEPQEKLVDVIRGQPGLLLDYMSLDTLFVISYLVVFGALFLCVPVGGRLTAALGLGFGILAGVSDMIENVLYIVYGLGSLHGASIAPALPFHYYVSQLKWIAAFTSIGLTTLVFPRRSLLEWLIVLVMATFPLGGALSIARPELAPLRAIFFVVGLPLLAILFARRAAGLGPPESAA